MRFVPSLLPTRTGVGTRGTRPVRPAPPGAAIDTEPSHEPRPAAAPAPVHVVEHRTVHPEDRRIACRRVSHQPVLLDLRSGLDRRHHKQRGTDLADHVDVEA